MYVLCGVSLNTKYPQILSELDIQRLRSEEQGEGTCAICLIEFGEFKLMYRVLSFCIFAATF